MRQTPLAAMLCSHDSTPVAGRRADRYGRRDRPAPFTAGVAVAVSTTRKSPLHHACRPVGQRLRLDPHRGRNIGGDSPSLPLSGSAAGMPGNLTPRLPSRP